MELIELEREALEDAVMGLMQKTVTAEPRPLSPDEARTELGKILDDYFDVVDAREAVEEITKSGSVPLEEIKTQVDKSELAE